MNIMVLFESEQGGVPCYQWGRVLSPEHYIMDEYHVEYYSHELQSFISKKIDNDKILQLVVKDPNDLL